MNNIPKVQALGDVPSKPKRDLMRDITLFACSFGVTEAIELVDGMSDKFRNASLEIAKDIQASGTQKLRAELDLNFGFHAELGPKLRTAVYYSNVRMEREIFRLLPMYLQSCFVNKERFVPKPGDGESPFLVALAQRIIHEVTR